MSAFANILGTREFTARHMLAVLLLFFGTIISVNLTLAWFAASSWTGLVVKNSYVESQRFNAVTAERLKGVQLGWKAKVTYDAGTLSVTLAGPQGGPVLAEGLAAKIGRPVHNRDDKTLEFRHSGGGRYEAATLLRAGLWQAEFVATAADGTPWAHAIRFTVKE